MRGKPLLVGEIRDSRTIKRNKMKEKIEPLEKTENLVETLKTEASEKCDNFQRKRLLTKVIQREIEHDEIEERFDAIEQIHLTTLQKDAYSRKLSIKSDFETKLNKANVQQKKLESVFNHFKNQQNLAKELEETKEQLQSLTNENPILREKLNILINKFEDEEESKTEMKQFRSVEVYLYSILQPDRNMNNFMKILKLAKK
jgi:hypothetical protein